MSEFVPGTQIPLQIEEDTVVCDILHYLGNGKYGVTIHKDYYFPSASRYPTYQILEKSTINELFFDFQQLFFSE